MDLKVFVRGVENGSDLRGFGEEKLANGLERFESSVLNATMRIEDVTGPEKHGVDKRCSIEIKLRGGEVHIKELGEDFYATIDVAIDRMKAVVSKEVAKSKKGIGEG